MVSKEAIVAILSLIMGAVSVFFGKQIFTSEETQQFGEIAFMIISFVYAYLHKHQQNGSESTPNQNSDK